MAKGKQANWSKFTVGMVDALGKASKMLSAEGAAEMSVAAQEWVNNADDKWDGSKNYPRYTGTLHDSVAVRVTQGSRNVAVAFMPMNASQPQTAKAFEARIGAVPRQYDEIVGWRYGRLFYGRSMRYSTNALASWLTIGVPYADYLNERGKIHKSNLDHTGYADYLFEDLHSFLESKLKALGKKAYKVETK